VDLFLDSSVLLSACASAKGASRYVIESAAEHNWKLTSAHYCREETLRNLDKLGGNARDYFSKSLEKKIDWLLNALTTDDVIVFNKTKDRPVLISALASQPDALLTLDRADFHKRLGGQFYGIAIRTPGEWLLEQRDKE